MARSLIILVRRIGDEDLVENAWDGAGGLNRRGLSAEQLLNFLDAVLRDEHQLLAQRFRHRGGRRQTWIGFAGLDF